MVVDEAAGRGVVAGMAGVVLEAAVVVAAGAALGNDAALVVVVVFGPGLARGVFTAADLALPGVVVCSAVVG